MAEGVFQTDRGIFKNQIWRNPAKFRLFFFIYGNAVYTEDGLEVGNIQVAKGQFLRSYRNLADDLEYTENNSIKRYSISRIKTLVDELVDEKRITIEATKLGTLFTVLNYEHYQGFERFNEDSLERRKNAERTQKERRKNNNNKVNKDNKDKKINECSMNVFIPPTLEEVKKYCAERKNKVDPDRWMNHYQAKGWMIGKNKMRDWKAGVRTWERQGRDDSPKGFPQKMTSNEATDLWLEMTEGIIP